MKSAPILPRWIHTDGSNKASGHLGGWGLTAQGIDPVEGKHILFESGGFEPVTTNNRMELMAIAHALSFALDSVKAGAAISDHRIAIISDSQYCVNSLNNWVNGWKRRGWCKSSGDPIKNAELMACCDDRRNQIEALGQPVGFFWVRGHSGDIGNERADKIATAFCQEQDLERAVAACKMTRYHPPLDLGIKPIDFCDEVSAAMPAQPRRHRITLSKINGIPTIETTRRIWKRAGIDRWDRTFTGPFLLFKTDVPAAAWRLLELLAGDAVEPVKSSPKLREGLPLTSNVSVTPSNALHPAGKQLSLI